MSLSRGFGKRPPSAGAPAVAVEVEDLVLSELDSLLFQERLLEARREIGTSRGGATACGVDHALPRHVVRAAVKRPAHRARGESILEVRGDLPVGDDHQHIGGKRFEVGDRLWGVHVGRLAHRQVEPLCRLLDCRSLDLAAAAGRAVGPGDDADDLDAGSGTESLEARDGKAGGAGEDQLQG